MKHSLGYNSLFLAIVTGLTLSLSACGGGCGDSDSSGGDAGGSTTNSSAGTTPTTPTTPTNPTTTPTNPTNPTTTTPITPTNPTTTPTNPTTSTSAPTEEQKKEMLKTINKVRSQSRQCLKTNKTFNATNELKWSDTLEKATKKFADDMVKNNYYDYFGSDPHLQPDTSKPAPWKQADALTFEDRKEKFGYRIDELALENLGFAGSPTSTVAIPLASAMDYAYNGADGWLQSKKGHCENIMDSRVDEYALSYAYNAKNNTYYFVQMFGKRKP